MNVDPLVSFVEAFEINGEPPAGWIEGFPRDGTDPLVAAWRQSRVPSALYRLLLQSRSPHAEGARLAWAHSEAEHSHCGPEQEIGTCPACAQAIRAAVPEPPSLERVLATRLDAGVRRAWQTSERGDELLSLASRAGVDRALVVLAACDCVRLAEQGFPVGDPRPLRALVAAERGARGAAPPAELEAVIKDAGEALKGLGGAASEGPAEQRERAMAARAATSAAREAAWAAHTVVAHGEAPTFNAALAAEAAAAAIAHTTRGDGEILDFDPPFSPSVRAAHAACAGAVRRRIPDLPVATAGTPEQRRPQ